MSANERRAELIRILEGRRQDSIANLAFQLGVSVRTIKYDIEALMADYPIETTRGNGGCVRLPKNYRMYQGDISDEQQMALISAIKVVDEPTAKALGEVLLAHGSLRNKEKIKEALQSV